MFRRQIARNLINYPGWRTHRKIVVIESDDWGSIRMPSKDVYTKLLMEGIRVDKCRYNSMDTIAGSEDLALLFDTLSTVKDKKESNPIITANCVVANPDFEKIKASDFQSYYYEPFTETLKRDKRTEGAFEMWKEGMTARLFHPQFHGREHVNVSRWMQDLRNNIHDTRLAFNYGVFGITPEVSKEVKYNYLAAMDYYSQEDLVEKLEIIETGLQMFKDIFGFSSKSYIATNYIWGDKFNSVLARNGVQFLQGQKKQIHPQFNGSLKYIRRILGQKNAFNQFYLIRNCVFEPSLYPAIDSVNFCLKDIQNAFTWHKPAIISSHRINFMGGIKPDIRNTNLMLFQKLLIKIVEKWPDVEFMSSDELGILISKYKI